MRGWPANACPEVARVYEPWRFTDDEEGSIPVEPSHNRWRLTVQYAAGVTAGDVKAFLRVPPGDGAAGVVGGLAGTIAYDADGGQLVGEWAPGEQREFAVEISGYTGAGEATLQLETWSDLPWR